MNGRFIPIYTLSTCTFTYTLETHCTLLTVLVQPHTTQDEVESQWTKELVTELVATRIQMAEVIEVCVSCTTVAPLLDIPTVKGAGAPFALKITKYLFAPIVFCMERIRNIYIQTVGFVHLYHLCRHFLPSEPTAS